LKSTQKAIILTISLPLLFLIALSGWRIDVFEITDDGGDIIFSSPMAMGQSVTTRYIHSVELTPVEDEYIVLGGRLWMWEERVRSSNAGLPSIKPKYGRFVETPQWFIYQGGRANVKEYYYRVGDSRFGLNQIWFEPVGKKKLYEEFKGERLTVGVAKAPFMLTELTVSERLADCDDMEESANLAKRRRH
jgi:hypothetical protein